MSFVQIVSFETDDITPFQALEEEWLAATEGRRTLVDGALYRDRDNPRRYVTLNHFASYEEAMVNSGLPETDELSRKAMALAEGPVEFLDLVAVSELDQRVEAASRLRAYLETNTAPPGLFAEDLRVELFVPNWAVLIRDEATMTAGLVQETHARSFDVWDVDVIPTGFVVQYVQRNCATAQSPEVVAVGSVKATVSGGRIACLRVHCAGNWDAELERQVIAAGDQRLVRA